MNKPLKWILIGLAIAVGVFLLALPVFYLLRVGGGVTNLGQGMMPFRGGNHHLIWGVLPLLGIFGFLRLLLPLAVLGFAVYGIVALARGKKTPAAMTTPPAIPVAPVPTAPERVCASCGRTLPPEGDFCPYCGAKQE
jgi:hypothetical protein